MISLRAAMLGCTILIATPFTGRAMAAPPVLAPPAAQALVANYMEAVRSNDLAAYAELFAPDARNRVGLAGGCGTEHVAQVRIGGVRADP